MNTRSRIDVHLLCGYIKVNDCEAEAEVQGSRLVSWTRPLVNVVQMYVRRVWSGSQAPNDLMHTQYIHDCKIHIAVLVPQGTFPFLQNDLSIH